MANRITVSLPQWRVALEQYQAQGLGEAEARLLEWLWGYLHQELAGDHERLAVMLDYDASNIYKVFAGKYEANLDAFLVAVRKLQVRAAGTLAVLVPTCVTKRFAAALDYARDYRAMVLVVAETGRSKSITALDWCRRNNHGLAVYVYVPNDCPRAKLARKLAKALGIGLSSRKANEVEEAVLKGVRKDQVLVFDEGGGAVPSRGRTQTGAVEFIRELHDTCECGVALLVTDIYDEALRCGAQAEFLEQFRGRLKYTVRVPKGKIFKDEVVGLCRAYVGAEPDAKLVLAAAEIAKQDGKLRTLCDDLAKARKCAAEIGKPLSAELLIAARAWREAGGQWKEETV